MSKELETAIQLSIWRSELSPNVHTRTGRATSPVSELVNIRARLDPSTPDLGTAKSSSPSPLGISVPMPPLATKRIDQVSQIRPYQACRMAVDPDDAGRMQSDAAIGNAQCPASALPSNTTLPSEYNHHPTLAAIVARCDFSSVSLPALASLDVDHNWGRNRHPPACFSSVSRQLSSPESRTGAGPRAFHATTATANNSSFASHDSDFENWFAQHAGEAPKHGHEWMSGLKGAYDAGYQDALRSERSGVARAANRRYRGEIMVEEGQAGKGNRLPGLLNQLQDGDTCRASGSRPHVSHSDVTALPSEPSHPHSLHTHLCDSTQRHVSPRLRTVRPYDRTYPPHGPLPTPAPLTRPAGRRRQPISCFPCRRSKLKCSGVKPCAQCVRRNGEGQCGYALEVRRRGQGKKFVDEKSPVSSDPDMLH